MRYKICTILVIGLLTCAASAQLKPNSRGGHPSLPISGGQTQIQTTEADFYHPGSQPDPTGYDYLVVSRFNCINCHNFDNDDNPEQIVPPYNNWKGSMMAQSARDPVFHAALTIANQDSNDGGVTCIRCHMPGGFVNARHMPSDGSALNGDDFDGVSCDVCHRMVDHTYSIENPIEDIDILADLADNGDLPTQLELGNGSYIIDPTASRRGPLDDVITNMHGVDILVSPFHSEAAFCGSCHDVSNPALSKQDDGTYLPNAMDAPHPTMNKYDMMPEQRTYSEWLNSSFATEEGVAFPDGRFTDNNGGATVGSCQDCHMPKTDGGICVFWELEDVGTRENTAEHSFIGSNSWVLGAVHNLYDPTETGLSDEVIALHSQRTELMMQKATDMDLSVNGSSLNVRITNWSGHSVPTGYPEGRRMWLNVRFLDEIGEVVHEHGHYDWVTADLTTSDTKVYETKVGMSSEMAKMTGLEEGPSFHLVLNNVVVSNNRIPPLGFTNEAFSAIGAGPVDYSYEDGQHWDDTQFTVPVDAVQAVVTLYHQTSSKEYMEFLRDANVTDDKGQIAYNQWELLGKSAPIVMDSSMIDLNNTGTPGDVNGDGVINVSDILLIISEWGPCSACPADVNQDGSVNVTDLLLAIANWG